MRIAHLGLFALAGCLVGTGGESSASYENDVASSERGLDYAWSRPSSPQAMRAAGYTFAARYLSYDTTGKNLTAGESHDLFTAGIDVVANWEWGASDALSGFSTGASEARDAAAQAAAAGMPADRPIYFSVDFDAAPGDQDAIDQYFAGVASVIGVERTGAYGGYYVIQRLFDHGKIDWGWQTYAWSGGQWEPRAQLRQIQNGVTVAGADCDLDQAVVSDFGQWGPNAPAAPPSAEGSQAFLYPGQQHYMMTAGDLRHSWWDATANGVLHDTWGSGVTGRPVTFVYGQDQHAFARGSSGTLEHFFYSPGAGIHHDSWGSGLAGDPAALVIGAFQDVWAIDTGGSLQHWWWGPSTNGVQHDTWGSGVVGRPSVMVSGAQQHVFAQGTGGTLEHWWWDPNGGLAHDRWGTGIASDPAALAIGDFQDVWAVDGNSALQHWWWGPQTSGVQHDTWGTGAAGRPSVFVAGNQQHVFARGPSGTLEHWFWDGSAIHHDTWGQGITGDPTAEAIGNQQHVWAQDGSGAIQHWYWDPATNKIAQDSWGQ
jgi:hypothetical protein